jgi:hypothetical protein
VETDDIGTGTHDTEVVMGYSFRRYVAAWVVALLGCMAILPVASVVVFGLVRERWPTGTAFEWKFLFRIKSGMTLEEVEGILGPGIESQSPVLSYGNGDLRTAVRGEHIFLWEKDAMKIWVGFEAGRVCNKWFWAPSL